LNFSLIEIKMAPMVSYRFAALQALREGPGYGQQLRRRVMSATRGQQVLAPGSLYSALRQLEESRLVRSWKVVPGKKRGGRSRQYFELTIRGIRRAEREAEAVLRLVRPLVTQPLAPVPTPAQIRARIGLAEAILEFSLEARAAVRGRRRS